MAYPRRACTFRFTEQTHELLEKMTRRTGLDKTALLERFVRAEGVVMSRTDAEIAAVLVKLPADYKGPKTKKPAGRKKVVAPTAAPDVPPPPTSKKTAAGLPRW